MKPNHMKNMECGNGRMPSMAPLANPYVPFQLENPPKYEPSRALIRGTIFPGLDLPFQGKVNTKELTATPMTQLQTLNFVIQELQLYLDTHRNDQEALDAYRAYQQMYRQCRDQYEQKYGPLNQLTGDECKDYRWLDDPWPWEYSKNKGVY